MSVDFESWTQAVRGGLLIGAAATLLLLFNGRIAGVSGVLGSLLSQGTIAGAGWKILFLVGLVAGGGLCLSVSDAVPEIRMATGPWGLALAGLLVGIGTRMGNGCTSGHGICGLARLSKRSLVATCTFMAAAVLTVFVLRHAWGAA